MSMSMVAPCSVDIIEESLSSVGIVGHEQFDALRVDIVRARNVVILRDVWQLVRQALPVQVLFAVVSLVLDHVIGHEDVLEASLLAVCGELRGLFVAAVQAQVVVLLRHLLRSQVD